MNKIIRIGTRQVWDGGRWASVYCHITYRDGQLSLTGVVGPLASGNAVGSCGQIIETIECSDGWSYAKGWTPPMRRELATVWRKWHLNDMRAGTACQMTYLEKHPVPAEQDWYEKALESLTVAGLNPDPVTGEVFGAAWYREEVPAEVIRWLESLPETDRRPAWC
jgi:hypothetical protein